LTKKVEFCSPKEIKDRMKIKPGDEFLVANIDENAIIIKKTDVKKMLKGLIEKVNSIDLEKEIEEEGNKVARKKYKISY